MKILVCQIKVNFCNNFLYPDENNKGGHVDQNLRQIISKTVFYNVRNSYRNLSHTRHDNSRHGSCKYNKKKQYLLQKPSFFSLDFISLVHNKITRMMNDGCGQRMTTMLVFLIAHIGPFLIPRMDYDFVYSFPLDKILIYKFLSKCWHKI